MIYSVTASNICYIFLYGFICWLLKNTFRFVTNIITAFIVFYNFISFNNVCFWYSITVCLYLLVFLSKQNYFIVYKIFGFTELKTISYNSDLYLKNIMTQLLHKLQSRNRKIWQFQVLLIYFSKIVLKGVNLLFIFTTK